MTPFAPTFSRVRAAPGAPFLAWRKQCLTHITAVNNAEKLAEDVEKSLKMRADPDLGSSSHPQATQQQDQAIKPRGVKVKEKAIRRSKGPIGGFEKAAQKRQKTKNDPKASGSACGFEKATRKKKKTNNDQKASGSAMEADTVTHS